MFKKFLTFFNKLTFFGKFCIAWLTSSVILLIIYLISNLFIVTTHRNLLNEITGEIISKPGIYFRPSWSHELFRNDYNHICLKAFTQDKSNNAYIIQIKIAYKLNQEWIKLNKAIPSKLEINQDNLNSYLIDNYINYSIEELNKENRKLQYQIISNYFNQLDKNNKYIIEEILIYRPLIQVQNIPLD